MIEQYRRKNEYEAVSLDGEWIIMNTDLCTVTKINEAGGFCWSLLSEVQSLDSLTEALINRYECDCDTAYKDADVFLFDLLRYGLIEYAG